MKHAFPLALGFLLIGFLDAARAAEPQAQAPAITTPKQHFGFNLGDDYCLANYQQLMSYWAKLEKESNRLKVVKIGVTEEGRPQLMGIVTSPANHKNLERYREIAGRMARAEVNEAEARKLASEGKAVVWIDGGLHATETLCAQMLMETLYQFLAANDEESLRILDDVIILFVHANPDGMDLVADNYMRNKDPKKRTMGGLPRLYQKYIGHDNNRDSYANTQAETKNMSRVLFRQWYPQIVYNHHQSGPAGTVLFCPPFRDPSNYNLDPLAINGIDSVGAAMMQRFLAENKPGATTRYGAPYATWWNGGLRTTTCFHNMIGLLTETIGSPTPMQTPYLPAKLLPKGDYLAPLPPQKWHFRQSVDYSVTANKAILDYASRNRQHMLYNIWRMGMNSIERGSRDSWTVTPKMVAAAGGGGGGKGGAGKGGAGKGGAGKGGGGKGGFGKGGGGNLMDFEKFFRDPAKRDPRGYILPPDQPDFLTATKFMNALILSGIKIQRATADFQVAGKKYPKGSYVVQCAQSFRPHIIDLFEPQDYPNDFAYPGAAPTPPYDAAGWTLAFQMGVQFDRILDGFDGPFEEMKDEIPPPPARVAIGDRAVGFYLDTRMNDAFRAVNQLLKAGEEVRRLQESVSIQGKTYPPGTFFIPRKATTQPLLEKIARELGTPFTGSAEAPGKQAAEIKPVRIALWDRVGGSMTSGWTRWLLERFEYPFKVTMAEELDNGGLQKNYDVLILVEDAMSGRMLEMTPQFKNFLEKGGTILAIGNATTTLGRQLGLPMPSQLVAKDEDGNLSPLSRQKYYVPSSVLRVRVNNGNPLAWGMGEHVDVMFSNSPTFKWSADAEQKGMQKLAWFDSKTPLRSGWAWGQEYLDGGISMIDARIGKGRLALFGPHILYRGQPHGTFKLLFNGIVQAGAKQ